MKKTILVALSLVALLLGAARPARADGIVDFGVKPAKMAQMKEEKPKEQDTEVQVETVKPQKKVAVEFVPEVRRSTASNAIAAFTRRPSPDPVAPQVERIEARPLASGAPRRSSVESLFTTMFQGGSNSLVAKAVGSAEGTRTPDGGKTWAYYGHVDPGNGKWNMGSFSYQHEASSPEDADERQLARLQRQFDSIAQIAATNGVQLSLEEKLNAIDLANQAPLAALDNGGYVERLRQAYAEGFKGSDAVLRARTYSYMNPRTNRWEAPGLGNTESSISRDQLRRQTAIYEAIQLHQQSAQGDEVELDEPSQKLKPKDASAAKPNDDVQFAMAE